MQGQLRAYIVMKIIRTLFIATILLAPVAAVATDPVIDLSARMKQGQVQLQYEKDHGYLVSLLKLLDVPVSSQTLVFSKTSLQSERISPQTPRALYFNDDVYVAWVQGSATIEIMSVESKKGARFYALDQENDGHPQFDPVGGHVCSVCHYVQSAKTFVPQLMMSSVIPDATGDVEGTFPISTDDETPMEKRWGGWYVTGTHGAQKHLGNVVLRKPQSVLGDVSRIDVSKSLNVTDLRSRFDTSRYLSPHSDIVALMVMTHQIEIHNRIALASNNPDAEAKVNGEPLVRAMLFADAAPLKEPIKGTSSFTSEFPARGKHDAKGRSLREFDLKTKLFRYPLSYMIYSSAFDDIPPTVKAYVYRRLVEVLSGKDTSPQFAKIAAADRTAILEILRDTKPDFPR
jgi:hypothetical protein